MKWFYHDVNIDEVQTEDNPITLKDLTCGKPIAQGANAVVYACKLNEKDSNQRKSEQKLKLPKKNYDNSDNQNEYPFALKMMFNYDIQSNSMAILNAMYREIVPARMHFGKGEHWEIE